MSDWCAPRGDPTRALQLLSLILAVPYKRHMHHTLQTRHTQTSQDSRFLTTLSTQRQTVRTLDSSARSTYTVTLDLLASSRLGPAYCTCMCARCITHRRWILYNPPCRNISSNLIIAPPSLALPVCCAGGLVAASPCHSSPSLSSRPRYVKGCTVS